MTFKPNLAGKADLGVLNLPVLGSPKFDGIRALVKNWRLISRKLLDIPNKYTFDYFRKYEGFDGELVVGDPTAPDVYRKTNSAVMSINGLPSVTYWVFDRHDMEDSPFEERYKAIVKDDLMIKLVPQVKLSTLPEVMDFEREHVELGYEGVMLRDPAATYKYGRSTTNEGGLLKLKRFEDSDAYVIDVVEEMRNDNEATRDELGRTKRSTHAENKVGKGSMGALHCKDVKSGVEFFCGTGFSAAERAWWWKHRGMLMAWSKRPIIKYKFFPVGVKVAPRHPVYIGLRSEIDL